MDVYLGIDPGKSGAVAALSDAWEEPQFIRLKETAHDVSEWIRDLAEWPKSRVIIEQVNAMPKQGVSSTFKFGHSAGVCEGLIVGIGLPYKLIRPAKWQQLMRCRTKGDKNISKQAAQRLFPGVKVTHATADALLLAELCRTQWDTI